LLPATASLSSLVTLLLGATPSQAEPASLPPILINEIMYDPAASLGEDNDYEWVELYNTTSQEIDLHGWKLNGVPLAAQLPAHSYLIAARQDRSDPDADEEFFSAYYDAAHSYTAITAIADLEDASLSFEEDEFEISLLDAVGNEVDEAEFYPPPGAHGDGTTLERIFTTLEAEEPLFLPSLDAALHGGPAEQSSRAPIALSTRILTPAPNHGDSLVVLDTLDNRSNRSARVTLYRHARFASGPTIPTGPAESVPLPPGTRVTLRRAFYIPSQCPSGSARYRIAYGPGGSRSLGSVFDEFIVASGDEAPQR
jgi:hypothetical protein